MVLILPVVKTISPPKTGVPPGRNRATDRFPPRPESLAHVYGTVHVRAASARLPANAPAKVQHRLPFPSSLSRLGDVLLEVSVSGGARCAVVVRTGWIKNVEQKIHKFSPIYEICLDKLGRSPECCFNRAKEELELKEALVNSLEEEKNEIRATLEKELARERRACRKSVEELKKSIHSLREELSLKTHVQKLMSENEKEWKEELTNYPGADERMRSLLLIFANVKKELAKAQSDRSALRKASASENAKLLVDLARLRREGAEKNKQISELNEQLDSTKAELDDVRRKYEEVEAVHGLKNYGSNARLKRKRNEGVRPSASQPVSSKRHLDSTIVLSSDEDEDENLNPFKTPEHDDGYRAPTYLKVNRRITKGSSRFGFNGMGGSAPLEDPFEPPQGRAHLAAKKPRVPKEKLRPAAPAGCLPIAAFLDRK